MSKTFTTLQGFRATRLPADFYTRSTPANPIMDLTSGYSKPRFTGVRQFRLATREECLSNVWQGLVKQVGKHAVLEVRVNGAPKLWKTRPSDLSLPVKYGMYEFGYIDFENGLLAYGSVLPVIDVTKGRI